MTKSEKRIIEQQAKEVVEKMSSVEIKNPYPKNPLDDLDFEDDEDED